MRIVIRNSRQASVSRRKYQDLTLAAISAEPGQRASLLSVAEDIAAELREYDAIRSGDIDAFPLTSLDELGDALVKARLARGWTQRDLAEKLGVTEQMVQRDEARSYEHAGLARLAEIADILGYELTGSLRPGRIALLGPEAPS